MDNLDLLTNLTNRSIGQTNILLGLLDNDYEKLMLLERNLKHYHYFSCPDTKEEISEILALEERPDGLYTWLTLKLYNTLSKYDNIIRCRYTQRFGMICREMKGGKDFPDQWGIYWLGPNEGISLMRAHRLYLKYGNASMYYWKNKDDIEFITNKFELKIG